MALFFPGRTECALCGKVVGEDDEYVGTTHFIGDESDPLSPYSDAVMHRACFLRWEDRHVFAARYNAVMGSITWGDGFYHEMQPDGTILSKKRG
jgi:hypothetical protein